MRLKTDIIEACQCLRMWLIIDRKEANTQKLKKSTVNDGKVISEFVKERNLWQQKTPIELYNFYDNEDALQEG